MDSRHLRYFAEVARLKSFTKASHSLKLSQPALSKMIRNLEEELDVTLIDRSKKQITLTDSGELVYQQAQRVLGVMDDLTSSLYDMVHLKKGTVEFGLPPLIGTLFFPELIAQFRNQFPGISIKITEYGAKRIEKSLEEGHVDVAVAVAPIDETIFKAYPFNEETMEVVLPTDHRLASKDTVELSELAEEKFILFQEDFAMHDIIQDYCQSVGFSPQIELESSQWDFIVEMVKAHIGIAIMPKSICEKIIATEVKSIPVVNPSVPWTLALIVKQDRYLPYAAREFIQFVRASKS
ncbi:MULTISPECIES: LysR family transcriptional regulator [Pontibacillus]|uniref:LysR family transcriptional regulator n=1 Tax=Pontibacillus chungwhensis TaxID=265426 RepID=A0ABY8V185_9BACI|nr:MULTISPECIES: LysR family transcriptional regulator [Pontibacillus]MCD5322425.1 LysR family transcriptional regulator [Pontibacillus sp. HN14]WIF99711.1 LysR family transcriptional regulator [Pontibacillus chungwhensis]